MFKLIISDIVNNFLQYYVKKNAKNAVKYVLTECFPAVTKIKKSRNL